MKIISVCEKHKRNCGAPNGEYAVNLALLAAAVAFAFLAAITTCISNASAQGGQAELSLERHMQPQELLPAAGDYVRYDVTIKNTGQSAIKGMSLWVKFAPVQGSELGSSAKFEVPLVATGGSAQLHLGPFKLHEAGEHVLYVGINKAGDAQSPDEVALNTKPGVPVDSVTALEPAAAAALPVGIGIAASGVGILAWVFFYVRKKRA